MFNKRDLAIEWRDDKLGLSLYIHKDDSFWQLSHVQAQLEKLIPVDIELKEQNPIPDHFRTAFIIAEAFVLDFECEDDTLPIVQYLKQRSRFDLESNLEGFRMCLSYEQAMIFHTAFLHTRASKEKTTEEPTEEEKKS